MEVEFVTLGDAAKMLDVPAPTLRGWSDKLEELHVHYLERNHRDERIFYESDMEIFKFIHEQKKKYGRKTTTTDLAYVILESDQFQLRQKGEVPNPPKVNYELSEIDYQNILEHPDFRTFLNSVIQKATSELSESIAEEITQKVTEEMDAKIKKIEEERLQKLDQLMDEQMKTKKMLNDYFSLPAYKRIFAKNPLKKRK